MHPNVVRSRILAALAASVAALVLAAAPALAHAQLVSSDPGDGAAVSVPTAITLTFDDDLDATKSRFDVVDASGATVATGHVAAADAKVMQATGLSLALGDCQVRWTAYTTDAAITRGIVSFTVIQPGAVSIGPGASAGSPASTPAAPPAPSGSDVILPIAAGLLLVAGVGAFVLRRSRAA